MKKYQLDFYCFEAITVEEGPRWINISSLNLPRDLLIKMDHLGIIEIKEDSLRSDQIPRIYKALRLQKTLGVNLAGAAVILDLVEEVERLKEEVERLKKR
ncbi:MAG: hypothetical protein D5R97_03385 [Candidatus Syntrophonatronum acetioxidans]|uniref:MerR family transcriptional regulator n=1 Tax=Candidatus Syntrophonatronum acetioxidans TaxID=1795816 RepID=A0A424YGB5_9FIRM|nr:MAG: hypothetical protein D5R97_03385 [Candidatus Syntrophonatronum acetioxidans]